MVSRIKFHSTQPITINYFFYFIVIINCVRISCQNLLILQNTNINGRRLHPKGPFKYNLFLLKQKIENTVAK